MRTETFGHKGQRYQVMMPFDNLWLMPEQLARAVDKHEQLLALGETAKIAFFPHPQFGPALGMIEIVRLPASTSRVDRFISKVLEFVGFGVVVLAVIALMTWLVTRTARR